MRRTDTPRPSPAPRHPVLTRTPAVTPASAPGCARPAVLGLGVHVPEQVLTNADLARMVETSDEWIVARTGIRTRRMAAPGEAASDLGVRAAEAALRQAGLPADVLDLIVCATTTPDMVFPATACLIQQRLGARPVGAFDLLAACSSFVYALICASQAIEAGLARHVLVVGTEVLTRLVDWTDRTTCVLIGDGAGAVVLGPARAEAGVRATLVGADGSAADILKLPAPGSRTPASAQVVTHGLHRARMDGQSVFKLAVRVVPDAIRQVVDASGLTLDDIAWFVPHQANQRIIEAVARAVGVPEDRFISTIERYGNTSSASIPISLWEAAQDGRLRDGDHIVLVAFGGGFTWSACVLTWGR